MTSVPVTTLRRYKSTIFSTVSFPTILRTTKPYPSSSHLAEYYTNFIKGVSGYHMVNDRPIQAATWKSINSQILQSSNCKILSNSSNISTCFGTIHNHTSKYSKDNSSFKLSSYHLNSVCSSKQPGSISNILEEIYRRNNADFISLLLRNNRPDMLQYNWYLIPRTYSPLNPYDYDWKPKIGKRGRNTGEIIGWETNSVCGSSMSITFNMSSQLWITLAFTEEFKKYRIASTIVNPHNKYNYIQLYNELLILSGKP